ncbi:uncharacterized protein LACBIDRAFT_334585 [Laccaria bicolor S238N-H82]|uniref:Predicted protein n=1 Tax=Laccaria bicolor (strain S238N-H82 / ATCC MYA-4686) TaxID=486041 RepID=B0DZK6_LACBS|nr:uncharacterized protein LACBIDRAFT_334585 [Laccaria bicolor S238N-H82]EDQ99955.1 predicted protein [Laccaria bicolor S238N-H82]|eukprot:XP_001889366.1 predicted protein [Laccaria bicolor S238N-H82]
MTHAIVTVHSGTGFCLTGVETLALEVCIPLPLNPTHPASPRKKFSDSIDHVTGCANTHVLFYSTAEEMNGLQNDDRDVQEWWINAKEEQDGFERRQWRKEEAVEEGGGSGGRRRQWRKEEAVEEGGGSGGRRRQWRKEEKQLRVNQYGPSGLNIDYKLLYV